MAFTVEVRGFPPGGNMPAQFTCDGANHSPAVAWSGAPPETRSYALILDDPDAPSGIWTHWLVWNIPAAATALPENAELHRPIHLGSNDCGALGYRGPCPPRGHGAHRYFFRVLALDVEDSGVEPGAWRPELDRRLAPHILASAEYMGRFERK